MLLDLIIADIEKTFNTNAYREAWPHLAELNGDVASQASPGFRANGNGLLLRGGDEVSEVYTAVFPTAGVLDGVTARGLPGSLLVCHYPQPYDGRTGFQALPLESLWTFRERGFALYVLHAPLAYSERLSTWRALARKLGIGIEGILRADVGTVGCYGRVLVDNSLQDAFDFESLAHRVEEELEITNSQVYRHGAKDVGRVAIVPGDGAEVAFLEAAQLLGCTTYVTGVIHSSLNSLVAQERSYDFLAAAARLDMDLIGGSVYATCAPGLSVLATWFQALGLPASFVRGEPEMREYLEA